MDLLVSSAMGYAWQWFMFGPKKIPAWGAWGGFLGVGFLLYVWQTPTIWGDFEANWRGALVPLVQFYLAAKGAGSAAKAMGIAPGTNTV